MAKTKKDKGKVATRYCLLCGRESKRDVSALAYLCWHCVIRVPHWDILFNKYRHKEFEKLEEWWKERFKKTSRKKNQRLTIQQAEKIIAGEKVQLDEGKDKDR